MLKMQLKLVNCKFPLKKLKSSLKRTTFSNNFKSKWMSILFKAKGNKLSAKKIKQNHFQVSYKLNLNKATIKTKKISIFFFMIL
jgi:hypothetical protein